MTSIAVLGAGVMASALTMPARDNGHEVARDGSTDVPFERFFGGEPV